MFDATVDKGEDEEMGLILFEDQWAAGFHQCVSHDLKEAAGWVSVHLSTFWSLSPSGLWCQLTSTAESDLLAKYVKLHKEIGSGWWCLSS